MYQTDPLALKDACRGISARCDLNTPWTVSPMNAMSPFGGTDNKITNDQMIKNLSTVAVSGPTWDSQPVFAWTEQWKDAPHFGHPQVFNFGYETFKPDY